MFRSIPLILVISVAFSKYINEQAHYNPLLNERIFGGANTTIEEYPYVVSLERNASHICGGSLLAPNVVLTAAHCFIGGSDPEFQIRAGSTFRNTGGQVSAIAEWCYPDEYIYTSRDYDMVVVKLNKSFTLGDSVQTIKIQMSGVEIPVGTLGTATGWGRLGPGKEPSKTLQVIEIPKVDDDVCKARLSKADLTERMTCYGRDDGRKDTCAGDSGGPLVVNGTQVGITSYGYQCSRPLTPGVYARIGNEELHKVIESCLTNFTRRSTE